MRCALRARAGSTPSDDVKKKKSIAASLFGKEQSRPLPGDRDF